MINNERFVKLSSAPQVILERIGVSLSKGEVLELGKEARMVFSSGKDLYVNIEAFVNHLLTNLKAPPSSEGKQVARKNAALRYRYLNQQIMSVVSEIIQKGTKSDRERFTVALVQKLQQDEFMNRSRKPEEGAFQVNDLLDHVRKFQLEPKVLVPLMVTPPAASGAPGGASVDDLPTLSGDHLDGTDTASS